jgi:hypothetical protein
METSFRCRTEDGEGFFNISRSIRNRSFSRRRRLFSEAETATETLTGCARCCAVAAVPGEMANSRIQGRSTVSCRPNVDATFQGATPLDPTCATAERLHASGKIRRGTSLIRHSSLSSLSLSVVSPQSQEVQTLYIEPGNSSGRTGTARASTRSCATSSSTARSDTRSRSYRYWPNAGVFTTTRSVRTPRSAPDRQRWRRGAPNAKQGREEWEAKYASHFPTPSTAAIY